jgi:hypothetical protein
VIVGDDALIPKGPLTWFPSRIREGLDRRPLKYKASTYRAFVFFGYGLAALAIGVMAFIYREPDDLRWAAYGAVAGVAFGLTAIYADAGVLRDRPGLEALLLLGTGVPIYLWIRFLVEPMSDTREGEMVLLGFWAGLASSIAIPGNLYYWRKRDIERGLAGPPQIRPDREAELRREERELLRKLERELDIRYRLVGGAAVLIVGSAGVMIWMAVDIAIDPEYGTWEEAALWIPLMSLALIVLAVGYFRGEARLMILAGMLSGFSFLGPMAAIGQVMLWLAHSRYGLPWKAGT